MPSVEGNVSGKNKVDVSGVSDDLNYKHEGSVVNRDANVLVEARIMDASDKKKFILFTFEQRRQFQIISR